MNLEYLTKTIIPNREAEISKGLNLATRNPLYVVLSLREHMCSGHSDISLTTNLKGVCSENGYIDRDEDEPEFCETEDGMTNAEAVTRFYTDSFEAFFLTSKSAHDYLKYQGHNLNDAYVYVFGTGYANKEMDELFK